MADLADVRFLHSRRFYQQFWLFALYFIISLVCFTMRPILVPDAEPAVATSASAGLVVDVTTYETPLSTAYPAPTNVNGSPPSLSASSPEPPPPLLAPGLTLMTDADVAESGADDLQLAGAEQATPTDSGEVEVNASRYDQDACYLSKVRWMDLFFFNWLSTLDGRSSVLFFLHPVRDAARLHPHGRRDRRRARRRRLPLRRGQRGVFLGQAHVLRESGTFRFLIFESSSVFRRKQRRRLNLTSVDSDEKKIPCSSRYDVTGLIGTLTKSKRTAISSQRSIGR